MTNRDRQMREYEADHQMRSLVLSLTGQRYRDDPHFMVAVTRDFIRVYGWDSFEKPIMQLKQVARTHYKFLSKARRGWYKVYLRAILKDLADYQYQKRLAEIEAKL